MDEILGYNPDDRASVSEECSRKTRRRSSKKKNAPTYENQKEVFNVDTLEEIRIFREARSQYLQAKDSRRGEFATDSTELFFGGGQSRRKQQSWLKRVSQGFMDLFNRDRDSKKPPLKTQPSKGGLAREKYMEEGVRPHEVKPAKSIMKIVTQKDIKERERKEKEREKELERKGSIQDVTLIDEKPVGKRKRRESSDLIVDEMDSRESDDDLYDDDVESIRRKRRDLDEMEMDAKKRKIAKGKQKGKKPLKFSRMPGPEEQCKCDHSGEYTVLVKGVCFCDRPKRPTCIPIIPPEYFKPHEKEPFERLKPDARMLRKDSIIVHRKNTLRRSKESLANEEKKYEDEPKKVEEEEEKELIELKPEATASISEEILASAPQEEQPKTKKYDDFRYERLMSPHRFRHKEDQHTPMHFQELPDEKSEIAIKPSRNDSLLSKSPSEVNKHPFLLRRKGSRLVSEDKRRGESLFEKPSTMMKTKKDKNDKVEHGHVHFDTIPHQAFTPEDVDTNKYYTKYGKSAEIYKRKHDKTTMTAIVDFFYDWWKRKP